MRNFWFAAAAAVLVVPLATFSLAQPPPNRDDQGPPPEQRDGEGPPVRPRPWEPGKVMPPPVRQALELTEDQEKQLNELEKEVKDRILKILTDEQKAKLKELRPMGPPPREGEGEGRRPRRQGRPPGPPDGGDNGPPKDGPGNGPPPPRDDK